MCSVGNHSMVLCPIFRGTVFPAWAVERQQLCQCCASWWVGTVVQATLRRFTCDDMFRFNSVNLDVLTETVRTRLPRPASFPPAASTPVSAGCFIYVSGRVALRSHACSLFVALAALASTRQISTWTTSPTGRRTRSRWMRLTVKRLRTVESFTL